jgi:hypothetical protein
MIERTEKCFEIHPQRLIADSAYGSAETLEWLVNERGIEPHIPVFDKSARKDGTFRIYRCPASKLLTSTGTLVNDGATLLYRASKRDCDICELKPRCCPKIPGRKVPRSIYESASDVARGIARTEAYVTSRRERKKIEMLFAHLKRILRLDRLRSWRCSRRVPARRHRSEPSKAGKAGPGADSNAHLSEDRNLSAESLCARQQSARRLLQHNPSAPNT